MTKSFPLWTKMAMKCPHSISRALFHGRDVSPNSRIEIGPVDGSSDDNLKIEMVIPSEELEAPPGRSFPNFLSDAPLLVMQVTFANEKTNDTLVYPAPHPRGRSQSLYTLPTAYR